MRVRNANSYDFLIKLTPESGRQWASTTSIRRWLSCFLSAAIKNSDEHSNELPSCWTSKFQTRFAIKLCWTLWCNKWQNIVLSSLIFMWVLCKLWVQWKLRWFHRNFIPTALSYYSIWSVRQISLSSWHWSSHLGWINLGSSATASIRAEQSAHPKVRQNFKSFP